MRDSKDTQSDQKDAHTSNNIVTPNTCTTEIKCEIDISTQRIQIYALLVTTWGDQSLVLQRVRVR